MCGLILASDCVIVGVAAVSPVVMFFAKNIDVKLPCGISINPDFFAATLRFAPCLT